MKFIKRKLGTIVLAFAVLVTPLAFVGCSNASVIANLRAVVAGANDVLGGMSAKDPHFAKAKQFAEDAQKVLDAYVAATSKGACVDVATIASGLVSAFQAVILPLLAINPLLAAAIVGIDVALRVVAANFHKCIVSVAAKASAMADYALDACDKIFADYLKTPKVTH